MDLRSTTPQIDLLYHQVHCDPKVPPALLRAVTILKTYQKASILSILIDKIEQRLSHKKP